MYCILRIQDIIHQHIILHSQLQPLIFVESIDEALVTTLRGGRVDCVSIFQIELIQKLLLVYKQYVNLDILVQFF